MRAAFIRQTGGPEQIQYGELPDPTPTTRQVLVKIGAVAVNPIDTYIRSGLIKMELPFPFVVGFDLAGTVVAVGPEAARFRVGDRVWGSNQGAFGRQGTFADFAAIDEDWLYPTPENVADETAAAGALVGITAALGLIQRAQLQAGETILVTGGSGGVGSTVVQMAKALGARVLTTAGSEEKAAFCRELGADEVILYRTESLEERLKELAPGGVDVWWEVARDPNFELAVAHLKKRGRFVLMAGREARPIFPVGPFYVKDCTLHGFAMFNATPEEQRVCALRINDWLASGAYRPRIGKTFPLSEAAAAHRLQEENTLQKAGTLSGKIVLKP